MKEKLIVRFRDTRVKIIRNLRPMELLRRKAQYEKDLKVEKVEIVEDEQ